MSNVAQLDPRNTARLEQPKSHAPSPLRPPGKLLESITFEKLGQFASRRRQLRVLKGCAKAAMIGLVALLISVVIDGLIPSATAQWIASGTFYLPVLVAIWIYAWRPWRAPVCWSQEAKLFEKRDATLRGNLLSALELSHDETSARTSLAFRQELQQQVANEIAGSDVEAMLPFESIGRKLKLLGGAAVLFGVLLVVPGLHGPLRVARVLAPFLDWGRASHLRIEILEPSSRNTSVALRDSIAIVAQLDRATSQTVELEIVGGTGSVRKLELSQQPASSPQNSLKSRTEPPRLATTLTATEASTRFRVTAGNASTPWYTLLAFERPAALHMSARVTLPDYADAFQLPSIDANGTNLQLLRGSKVDWIAEFNQPVTKANWLLKQEEDEQSVPFTLNPIGMAGTATLQPEDALSLRLELLSSSSGLNNGLPSARRIEVQTDAPPKLRWQTPTRAILSKAASDVVNFSLAVEDELPLRNLKQIVRVISSQESSKSEREIVAELEHQRLPKLSTPDLETLANGARWNERIEATLDLLPLNLAAGDRVEVTVRATDLRGQTHETPPLLINVSSVGLNLAPDEAEIARERLAKRMEDLTASLPSANELSEFTASKRQSTEADLAKKLDGTFPILMADIKLTLETTTSNGTAHEMLQLGLGLQQFRDSLDTPQSSAPSLRESKRRLDELRTLSRAASAFSADDIARRHAANLLRLGDAFESLATDIELKPQTNSRQQTILFRQAAQITQDMLDSIERLPEQSRIPYLNTISRLENLIRQSESKLAAADPAFAQGSKPSRANAKGTQKTAAEELRQFASGTASALRSIGGVSNLHSWIPEQATRALQQLSQFASPAGEQMRQHLLLDDDRDREDFATSARELSERRELARASSRSTGEFSADLGLASRAVEETQSAEQSSIRERLEAISQALRILEVAEGNSQAASHLRDLLETEHWRVDSPEAATESPRVWDSYHTTANRNAQLAAASQLAPELKDRLSRLTWNASAAEVRDIILSRRWNASNRRSASQPLEELLSEIETLQLQLDREAATARRVLEQLGPTLEELAEKAAEETRELSEETRKSADPANEIKQQTTTAEKAIDRLREALVDLGDSQNLLRSEQLETARLADEGIKIADQASESISKATDLFEPDSQEDRPTAPSKMDIAQAAAEQEAAAQALDDLAQLISSQANSTSPKNRADQAAKIASRDDESRTASDPAENSQPSNDRFAEARNLAKIAESNPEELLKALEATLPKDANMQAELSDIARALTEQAYRDLERAESEQSSVRNNVENSDPSTRQQKQELQDILQQAQRETRHLVSLFFREASTAAQLAKRSQAKSSLAEIARTLEKHLEKSTIPPAAKRTLSELQNELQRLSRTLSPAVTQLNKQASELLTASEQPFHSNGSELNNRRRSVRDRASRVRSQDAKNLNQLAQQLQQQLQPIRDQLRLAQEELQQAANHSMGIRDELRRDPNKEGELRLQRAQEDLALARAKVSAMEGRLRRSEQRMQATQARAASVKQTQLEPFESQNPSAELAARIAEWTAARTQEILEQIPAAELNANPTSATSQALKSASASQAQVQRRVSETADNLERASRHEGRLENEPSQQELATAAAAAKSTANNELAQVSESINESLSAPSSESTPGQATAQSTRRVMAAAEQGREAIENTKNQLGAILGRSESTDPRTSKETDSGPSQVTTRPLTPRQMAELLNELDDRLNETKLGAKEDDSSPAPASEGKSSPSTLKKAAEQLAKSLSRSRSNPTSQANSDLGMATDSELANVEPQGPTQVQLLDVTRVGADWGKLREQTSDDALQSDRRTLAPHLQRQVDAYFKNIGQEVGNQ